MIHFRDLEIDFIIINQLLWFTCSQSFIIFIVLNTLLSHRVGKHCGPVQVILDLDHVESPLGKTPTILEV